MWLEHKNEKLVVKLTMIRHTWFGLSLDRLSMIARISGSGLVHCPHSIVVFLILDDLVINQLMFSFALRGHCSESLPILLTLLSSLYYILSDGRLSIVLGWFPLEGDMTRVDVDRIHVARLARRLWNIDTGTGTGF